jgi:hypothetical protein
MPRIPHSKLGLRSQKITLRVHIDSLVLEDHVWERMYV